MPGCRVRKLGEMVSSGNDNAMSSIDYAAKVQITVQTVELTGLTPYKSVR